MIHKQNNQTILEFGTGDICVNPGHMPVKTNLEKIKGFVAFTNQIPREIGEEGKIKAGVVDMNEFDVIMRFADVRSIDVVIKALEEARKAMMD